jgi:hypothetical protein
MNDYLESFFYYKFVQIPLSSEALPALSFRHLLGLGKATEPRPRPAELVTSELWVVGHGVLCRTVPGTVRYQVAVGPIPNLVARGFVPNCGTLLYYRSSSRR